jgi:beta-carotene hydroxylase
MIAKPSLESLGVDLLETSVAERIRCLVLPFATALGFFVAWHQGWWAVSLLCGIAQSFFTYASVSHDLVHRTLRLPPWLNECLLCAIEALCFRSGHAFRMSHLVHHRCPLGPDDIEGAAARMGWLAALWEGLLAQPKMWFWALRRSQGAARVWILLEGALVLVAASLCVGSEAGQAYLLVTVGGSWVYPLMTSYLPHDASTQDPLRQTRLYRGRVVALLSVEHLYHLEHHLYPMVPHQRWPELGRRLDPFFSEQGLRPIVLWR